jgi:hypothetical protein
MLVRNITDINIEDEFIRVNRTETVYSIVERMMAVKKCNLDDDTSMCSPILAAYVMDDNEPVGVVYKDTILEKIILSGEDPKKLYIDAIMEPPTCMSVNSQVKDVVNLILDKGLMVVAICDGKELVSVISVFDAIYLKEAIAIE